MTKLYDLQELVDFSGLPERTVRYYLAKVLDAPGGTRGRKAFYTQLTLDQLKLAKQILMLPYDAKRGEVKPSLKDFEHWLKSQSAEEIHAMAEMPYRIKPKMLLAASAPQPSMAREEEPGTYSVAQSESVSHSYHEEKDIEKITDTAAQYLNRVMGRVMGTNPGTASMKENRQTPWQSFTFGDDLEIKIRKPLTPTQKQQLTLAGQLLQSMLEKEQQ